MDVLCTGWKGYVQLLLFPKDKFKVKECKRELRNVRNERAVVLVVRNIKMNPTYLSKLDIPLF